MSFELGRQPFDGNGYPFSESCLLGCEFLRIQPVAFVQDDDEPLFGPERNPGVEGAYFFRVVAGIGYQQYDGALPIRSYVRSIPMLSSGRRFRGYLPYR